MAKPLLNPLSVVKNLNKFDDILNCLFVRNKMPMKDQLHLQKGTLLSDFFNLQHSLPAGF
jgi:hypothetical protein